MKGQPRYCVYRAYNAEGELLYVGTTGNGLTRLSQHTYSAAWWDDVAFVTIEHAESREIARDIEHRAIESEKPIHNWPRRQAAEVLARRDAALRVIKERSEVTA